MKDDILPVGKLDMRFLSGLLEAYTMRDSQVTVGARVGEDAAVLEFGERYLVMKTNPITFATDQIGWYVVNVCVNNMVVRGVRPRWMLNCVLLPEGKTTTALVEDIFSQIYEASRKVGVLVIGGHTEVTYGLDRPIVTGFLIGETSRQGLVVTGGAQVGDVILITKALGVEGTAIIASELSETLKAQGYDEAFIAQAQNFLYDPGISIYEEALIAAETGYVHCMTDATEGGLATALHEMAEAAGVGVLVRREDIPLLPATEQICRLFGLDPLGLIASGLLIMTVPEAHVASVRERLAVAGITSTPIGMVTLASEGRRLSEGGHIRDLPYFAVDEITKVL